MLGRSADALFWMGRYVERADNLARLLDVGRRTAVVPGDAAGDWDAIIRSSGCGEAFYAQYPAATADTVIAFLLYDLDGHCSIRSCLRAARNNARTVRTSLTSEMWEVLSETWQKMSEWHAPPPGDSGLRRTLEWVKRRCALFRGVTESTVLRHEGYDFLRIGTFLERADCTARILDVRSQSLDPGLPPVATTGAPAAPAPGVPGQMTAAVPAAAAGVWRPPAGAAGSPPPAAPRPPATPAAPRAVAARAPVGAVPGPGGAGASVTPAPAGPVDAIERHHWISVLRATSSVRAYHWVYHSDYRPAQIVDLLVLNAYCSRSLNHCLEAASERLERLARVYARRLESHNLCRGMLNELRSNDLGTLLAGGLDVWLTSFIARNNALSQRIALDYHFYPAAP